MAGGSHPMRAILYALFANFGIAIAKTWAAFVTGSSSMTAEAIHSYADTGNQVLLLIGLQRSKRPPDDEHPLGYGKATYVWSFIVAILLFSIGGLFSLYEGWHKLHATEPIQNAWIALSVLAVSIALEAVSMRGCLVEVRKELRGRSLWRWTRESRSSELIVVFGEDLAALLGLAMAFAFVGIASTTGDPRYDAYGSIAVGSLLVVIAIFVAIRVKSLLIGRSADPDIQAAISSAIAYEPNVAEVFNVITVQVGPQVMLAAKLRIADGVSLRDAIDTVNRLEVRLKREIPEIGWCFVETDVAD